MSEEKFQGKYRITTFRAPWHDYRCGAYFVTICTKDREHYFGEIRNNENGDSKMYLSPIGEMADECWRAIPQHFPHVQIPLWVVMPDHIHGIVIIDDSVETQNVASLHDNETDQTKNIASLHDNETDQTQNFASLQNNKPNKFGPQSKNLASVIRGFKIGVTKFARQNNIPFAWQSRYYDRIIRDSAEMNRIAEYIKNNVAEWDLETKNT